MYRSLPPLRKNRRRGPFSDFSWGERGLFTGYHSRSVVRLTVSRQTGLKFNHRPSRKVIFYLQPPETQSNINSQNVSVYFKSHYFSWSSQTFGFWIKNLWTGKTTNHVLKNALSEHNTLHPSYILKYFEILYIQGRVQAGWIGWLAWSPFRTAHLKKINTRTQKTEIRAIAMHANAWIIDKTILCEKFVALHPRRMTTSSLLAD